MRILLIGCEVIIRELCDAVTRSPHVVDARFLSKGLHDLGAKAMRAGLQAAIDEAEAAAEKYDAIALGYGLCGNGLAGLEARSVPLVVPRAHDCITLLMGSRDRFEDYFRGHAGVYYRSSGWVERGADLEPLARSQTGVGASLDDLVDRYGEENGRFLFEELTRYQSTYQQLTFIETGIEPDDRFRASAAAEAVDKGWKFEVLRGDLGLFRGLLSGAWDESSFLLVPPRHRIVARPEDCLIAAERTDT
ncbi:DUF1638 domain-containing protein [Aquisphaera insulae]|uniref:DUF1638 domain-containing protein n=1 Tax=Aquisphaera insulae TaxID=2712864 RepID=UPI0013EBFF5E|nr:DUF1638 domain-containing protein [Aquisphaera insulae]